MFINVPTGEGGCHFKGRTCSFFGGEVLSCFKCSFFLKFHVFDNNFDLFHNSLLLPHRNTEKEGETYMHLHAHLFQYSLLNPESF